MLKNNQCLFFLWNSPLYFPINLRTSMNVSKAMTPLLIMFATSSPFVLAFCGVNRSFQRFSIFSPFF